MSFLRETGEVNAFLKEVNFYTLMGNKGGSRKAVWRGLGLNQACDTLVTVYQYGNQKIFSYTFSGFELVG